MICVLSIQVKVCFIGVSVAFQDVYFGLVPQSARVWLPDPEEVWRSAELTRAFTPGDQVLSLRLEDGSVRDRQWIGNLCKIDHAE